MALASLTLDAAELVLVRSPVSSESESSLSYREKKSARRYVAARVEYMRTLDLRNKSENLDWMEARLCYREIGCARAE